MKKHFKKIISVAMAIVILASILVAGSFSSQASGTGAGLAEWALNAYYSHWSYVYGGATPGAVDCSGLIYSYCGGERCNLEYVTPEIGSVSSGIPRVHGLGLHQPGHFGVYIGDGMAVDARNESSGVCYESVYNKSWVEWFKVAACTYITNGWEKFNGNYYYYENGEYVVSTSREIGGVTYNFDSSGASDKTPEDMSAVANSSGSAPKRDNSSDNSSSSSSSDNDSSNDDNSDSGEVSETPKKSTVLKVGSSGDLVTKLQQRLADLGFYDGPVTGYFGEATESAYKAFQEAAGLNPDGLAGKDERKLLYSESAPTAVKSEDKPEKEEKEEREDDGTYRIGDENENVVSIQQQLADLGYYSEDVTGFFGEITQQAVINFQFLNGLEATGIVDEETYNLLFSGEATPFETEEEDTETTDEALTEETYDYTPSTETVASSITEIAGDNIEVAQKVVRKANRVTKNALSAVNDDNTVTVKAEAKNSNFLVWMLVLLGVAAAVSGVMFILNKRNNSYSGTRARGSRKSDVPVRYW